MKMLLLPLLEGLLWFLRLLPQKPQPSQVRDTQPESEAEPDFESLDGCHQRHRTRRNAITETSEQAVIDAYERLDAELSTTQRKSGSTSLSPATSATLIW